jgi:hypothetical protein
LVSTKTLFQLTLSEYDVSPDNVYNAYEKYAAGTTCALNYGAAHCNANSAEDPKLVYPNDDLCWFSLCCVGSFYSGGSCLRVQNKEKYDRVYFPTGSFYYPRITNTATVTVQYTGRLETFTVNTANSLMYIPQFGRVYMETTNDGTMYLDDITSYMYYRDSRDSSSSFTDISKWFMVPIYDPNVCIPNSLEFGCRLGISPYMYAKVAKCTAGNDLATSSDPDHQQDQFYIYRNQTFSNAFISKSGLLDFSVVPSLDNNFAFRFNAPPSQTYVNILLTNLG